MNVLIANDINNMEPGRELDAMVAEKVMGWRKGKVQRMPGGIEFDTWHFEKDGRPWTHYDWDPSTNLLRAWEVVEKMKIAVIPQEQAPAELMYLARYERFPTANDIEVFAATAPEAICKAALIAVMEQ